MVVQILSNETRYANDILFISLFVLLVTVFEIILKMTSTNAIASTMLRRSLEDRMEQSENDLSSWIHNHTGQFTAYVAGALCAILIVYCFVRELVFHKWGYDCCPGMKRGRSREDQLQMAADARMALELQQSLQEEDRRLAVEGKRMERRQKYEKFLVPYTMVSSCNHRGVGC